MASRRERAFREEDDHLHIMATIAVNKQMKETSRRMATKGVKNGEMRNLILLSNENRKNKELTAKIEAVTEESESLREALEKERKRADKLGNIADETFDIMRHLAAHGAAYNEVMSEIANQQNSPSPKATVKEIRKKSEVRKKEIENDDEWWEKEALPWLGDINRTIKKERRRPKP